MAGPVPVLAGRPPPFGQNRSTVGYGKGSRSGGPPVCQHWAMASEAADPPADRLAELVRRELREARTAALAAGADPAEVTADLTERVRRLRERNAATGEPEGG
jgi:hypothetical protein